MSLSVLRDSNGGLNQSVGQSAQRNNEREGEGRRDGGRQKHEPGTPTAAEPVCVVLVKRADESNAEPEFWGCRWVGIQRAFPFRDSTEKTPVST